MPVAECSRLASRLERAQYEREHLVALLLAQTALLARIDVPESLQAEAEGIAGAVQDAQLRALEPFEPDTDGVDDKTEVASLRAQLVAVREQLAKSEAAAARSAAAVASHPSSGRPRRLNRSTSSPPIMRPMVTARVREVGGVCPSEESEVWVAPESGQAPQPVSRRGSMTASMAASISTPPPPPSLQDALAQLPSPTPLRRPAAGSLGYVTKSTASSPGRLSHATPAKARTSMMAPASTHRHGATQPGFRMQPGAKAIRPSEPLAGTPMQPSVPSSLPPVSSSPWSPPGAEAAAHQAGWAPSSSFSLPIVDISAGQAPSPQGAVGCYSSIPAADSAAPDSEEAWHDLLQATPFQSDSTPDARSPLSGAGAPTPAAIEGTRDALRRKLRSCDARLSELSSLAADEPQLSNHEAFSYYQALRYLLALASLVSRVLETPLDVHSLALFQEVSRLFGPPPGLGSELQGI